MAAEWLLSAVIIAVCSPTFGHFESVRPLWTRIARWWMYLAVTAVLGATIGRPWTLIWVLSLPILAIVFHTTWCLRHGIHPITSQPRDRYEQLRARPPTSPPPPRQDPSAAGGLHRPPADTVRTNLSRDSPLDTP